MPTKTIPSKEVTRRCLRRIQRWSRVMPLEQQERDWSWFALAFPEAQVSCSQVMKALQVLELAGFIRVSYPNGRFNPEAMRIQLVTQEEVR